MTNMNNTSLYDQFDAPIKADIESLRNELKATREADAILTSHLWGIIGKNFENSTNSSSAVPVSQTDKAGKCRKVNHDTTETLNSMTGEYNKKITVEEISSDDVCDNCGAEPSDIESTTREYRRLNSCFVCTHPCSPDKHA